MTNLAADFDRRSPTHASRWRDGARRIQASRLRCCCTAPASSPKSGTTSPANSRQDYTVYALDRRGHGDSHKPAADRYHFQDFAEDVCRVIEALDLTDIYGIGHSAGATDLLLAAKLLPCAFRAPVRDGADGDGSARGAS